MSVSRSFATLSPYYVYQAHSPKSLGFGNTRTDNATYGVTIAASPTVMIAASQGTTNYEIWYTSNAKNWTRSSSAASAFGTNPIFSMCFGNNIFVAVGDNATIATSPSTDGGTWTSRTRASGHGSTVKLKRVFYHKDKFIIWDENGYASYSTDGATWTNIGNIGDEPSDSSSNGGSGTIIYNSSNSALYAFPDNYEQAVAPQTKFYMSPDDFTTKTEFQYSGSSGVGARFVYARNVDGYQVYIGTSGRSSSTSPGISGGGHVPFFIEIPLTTVGASTYAGTGVGSENLTPIVWPTTHKIPTLNSPIITSNAQASDIPAIFPLFGGAVGSQNGFWINYENGYWNLIGTIGYAQGAGQSFGSLGACVMRWKAEDGILEHLSSLRGGAMYDRTETLTPSGASYNFAHRVTQVNGGNEVVFKDKIYICAQRGSTGFGSRDLIVGSRKLLPLRTTVNY
jgi:hypothetical protein